MVFPRPRAFAAAIARSNFAPQCPTCGGPEAVPKLIAVLFDGEQLGECGDCGHLLDAESRPVGDGKRLKVIRLGGERPPGWPDMPRVA